MYLNIALLVPIGAIILAVFIFYQDKAYRLRNAEAYSEELNKRLKFFYKRRDNIESTHMIIMDAIAHGLDINKIIKGKRNSADVYERWYSWRNHGYYYNEDWSNPREWIGGKINPDGSIRRIKNRWNISIPFDFHPSQIPLDKYKHLKPRSGKTIESEFLDYWEKRSFDPKDLEQL